MNERGAWGQTQRHLLRLCLQGPPDRGKSHSRDEMSWGKQSPGQEAEPFQSHRLHHGPASGVVWWGVAFYTFSNSKSIVLCFPPVRSGGALAYSVPVLHTPLQNRTRLSASVPQSGDTLEGLMSLKILTLSPALQHLLLAPS